MEFWPENPGQSPLYSKFGTVPGRNCTHNYHTRHQEPHYPLYYGEQQDQGRESSYWTVPGSRAGGAPQEYTSWTDQELTAPTASHFPFILDRHAQQHQDRGHYQLHRDREWTAAPRAAREHERGFLREGWQRRWEPCGPVRYNSEVSAKRCDSSYRELEAWAARYSHSLPRRRRLEAELRSSQALLESSRAPERDGKSGMDPRVAALQQVRQSANIRESGLWDRVDRQKAPAYYPSQTPATNTSHMMDMKEKAGYQQRMFSQPPGYIAPPPYNSPHKSPPVLHQCDASWEQEGKKQPYWPTLREQDVSVDLQDHKNEFTKPDGTQKSFPEVEGPKHRRRETDALQAFSIQEAHTQPQVLQAVENKKIHEQPSSKIIEGRKFRLNKKTGGLTIFCLVSRIAGTAETQSLPLCTFQTNIENIELGDISEGLRGSSGINQTHKLADEVDFKAPTVTEQSNLSDTRNVKDKEETPACVESQTLGDDLSNKAETENVNTNDAHPTCGRQAAQPASVKYPLWREPSITSRAETESSSTWLKAENDEGETDALQNPESEVHPIDAEGSRLDMETDTEPEDSKGLLVIDTTRVVVKMELIQSPKKEHVHYLHTEHSVLDNQSTVSELISLDVTADQSTETNPFHGNEAHETKPDSELMGEKAPETESGLSLCMPLSSVSEGEMLEERAERILGIPLNEPITEQPPADETSLLVLCVQTQQVEPSSIKDNDTDDAVEQIQREEEQSQNEPEVCPTEKAVCLQDSDEAKDQAENEGGGGFAAFDDEVSNVFEENDSQLENDIKLSTEIEKIEDPASEEQEENDPSSDQCPPTNLSDPPSFSPSPDCEAPDPALPLMLSSSDLPPLTYSSEANIDEGPDPELIVPNSTENPPPPPESADSTPCSTPHSDHSPSPSPLDLTDQTAEAVSDVEYQEEEDETPQLINNEITDAFGKDITDEQVSQQQFESEQTDTAALVKDSNAIDEQQIQEADPIDNMMEQTPDKSKEDAIEVDIWQPQLECAQTEEYTGEKESYITEELLPTEVNEDAASLLGPTTSLENSTQMEVSILQHECDDGQEEDASLKESYLTKDQSLKESDEDRAGQLEHMLATENAADSQTQLEVLQDVEPQIEPSSPPSLSDSDCEELALDEFPSPPPESNEPDTVISLLETLSPDAAPAAGIPETDPRPLDSCEESPELSSSSTDSPPVLPPSSSTPPPQEGGGSIDLDLPLKEEPQYPKSLWDVVNRIRKHTAPDSENEEEEVSELWDPESLGGDLSRPDVLMDIHSGRIIFDGAEDSTEGSVEDVELGNFQEDPCHEEPSRQAEEEDTLSCSSTSSHGSGDTVIVADEEEAEETPPEAGTEGKMEDEEEFQTAEGKQSCSAEVKDETAAKEEGDNDGGENITDESSQSEECPEEAVEEMETEVEVFMVSDERMSESELVK